MSGKLVQVENVVKAFLRGLLLSPLYHWTRGVVRRDV